MHSSRCHGHLCKEYVYISKPFLPGPLVPTQKDEKLVPGCISCPTVVPIPIQAAGQPYLPLHQRHFSFYTLIRAQRVERIKNSSKRFFAEFHSLLVFQFVSDVWENHLTARVPLTALINGSQKQIGTKRRTKDYIICLNIGSQIFNGRVAERAARHVNKFRNVKNRLHKSKLKRSHFALKIGYLFQLVLMKKFTRWARKLFDINWTYNCYNQR